MFNYVILLIGGHIGKERKTDDHVGHFATDFDGHDTAIILVSGLVRHRAWVVHGCWNPLLSHRFLEGVASGHLQRVLGPAAGAVLGEVRDSNAFAAEFFEGLIEAHGEPSSLLKLPRKALEFRDEDGTLE